MVRRSVHLAGEKVKLGVDSYFYKAWHGHFGQEVENVLKLVDDLMVDWQLALYHFVQVRFDVVQAGKETFEAVQLIGQLLTQTSDCDVTDITQKMLDTNFFGLFSADLGWDVLECLRGWCSVLK